MEPTFLSYAILLTWSLPPFSACTLSIRREATSTTVKWTSRSAVGATQRTNTTRSTVCNRFTFLGTSHNSPSLRVRLRTCFAGNPGGRVLAQYAVLPCEREHLWFHNTPSLPECRLLAK